MKNEYKLLADGLNELVYVCYSKSKDAGWWVDKNDQPIDPNNNEVFGLKVALIHSEVSEALEGKRKNLFDDHLPNRRAVEVELADAIIRIADLAGAMGLDLSGALVEKLEYNSTRKDHQLENRRKDGGKAF